MADPSSVEGFLLANKFLIPLLEQARTKISHYFGYGATASLQVFSDPEGDDEELYVLIRSSLAPNEELIQLGRLDREWWLERVRLASNKMTISLD